MINKLSIIIPAYNEAATIHLILDKVKDVQLINNITKEIILVNDCSSDNTVEAIKKYIAENYVRTKKRCIKRNLLYDQIDLFLSRFELELTKELRKNIVSDILADESKQHRPFYLRRKYG